MTGDLITPRELARILSVPIGTIWAWTSTGKLPVIRISDRTPRYDLAEIRRWIEQCRIPGSLSRAVAPREDLGR